MNDASEAVDQGVAFTCALAAAGLTGLAPGDLAFLREAFGRMQKPLPLPAGFDNKTPAASTTGDLFGEAAA